MRTKSCSVCISLVPSPSDIVRPTLLAQDRKSFSLTMIDAHLPPSPGQTWNNFSLAPSYVDLVTDMWSALKWYYAPHMWQDYVFPHSFIDEFTRHYRFPAHEVYYVVYIALFFTIVRFAFERIVSKVRFHATLQHVTYRICSSVWSTGFN